MFIIHTQAKSTKKKKNLTKKQIQVRLEREKFLSKFKTRFDDEKPKFVELKAKESYNRSKDLPSYPSLNSFEGNTEKASTKVYTGTKLIGIATMHKSNMVPVFSKDEAEQISKMRRN